MRKKCILALMLAAMLVLSGCALVTVDEAADNARVILDVDGETVNKAVFHNMVEYQLYQNQQMNSYYQMLGLTGSFSTDENTVAQEVLASYTNSLVAKHKAAELGFDQMTEEENQEIQETAEKNYEELLTEIKDHYLADSASLDEAELRQKAMEYANENGMSTLENYLDSAKIEKSVEKLRADTVKDVTYTQEELQAKLDEEAAANKTTFESNPDYYGYYLNNGTPVYYNAPGYRMVKQVLVKFNEEDNTALTEKNTELSQAKTALNDAQSALTEAAEDADKTALQAAVDEAQAKLDEVQAAYDALKETAYANIQAKADEIYQKAIAEGADFDALVAEFNEDTGMPAAGYAVREGYSFFVASFVDAAMALEKVGDVSEPVKSDYGFHIIQYSADITEGTVALETVSDTLGAELLSEKQDQAYADALAAWVSEAKVESHLEKLH
ncbi:MAG: peptidylprolyl isomerase [Eubacteriales bacterium]|nr:peptidylprolyl isomerase [Eubacteriales bacterium]